MKLLLTKAQLLKEWRLRSFPEPDGCGCTVVQTGGADLKAYLEARMDDWYRALLADAPVEMLAPVDIADRAATALMADGTARIGLPEETVRVVSLTLDGLGRVTTVHDPAGASAICMRHRHRINYRGAGRVEAVAVVREGAVDVYPSEPFSVVSRIVSLMAVVDVPGEYRLDSRALGLITEKDMYKTNNVKEMKLC